VALDPSLVLVVSSVGVGVLIVRGLEFFYRIAR
jgi:hypothetical protein